MIEKSYMMIKINENYRNINDDIINNYFEE